MATIREVRDAARDRAKREGVPARDVNLLLADALGREPVWLLAHDSDAIDDDAARAFESAVDRRAAGEPMQYIRGRCEFYGREFLVDRRVLIPRPETELLVELLVRLAPRRARLVDVGAGSGCIAITLAAERPDLEVVSVDLSPGALSVARVNAERLGVRVAFAGSDLLSACRGPFDIIASNPPYVADAERDRMQREVVAWEPHLALFAGEKGMAVIERLLAEAEHLLAPRGVVALEIGYDQAQLVAALAAATGWRIEIHPDLAGIPRVALLRRR
jgi:release factor glutamine methyltransferase